jgi:hypothetical protein
MCLKGIKKIKARKNFTIKSAKAKLTQKGASILNIFNKRVFSFAQEVSLLGSMNDSELEKAI